MKFISILYLEDNTLDVELVQGQFDAEDLLVSLHHVANRSDFENALVQCDFDIVLADYSLPSFSGMQALEIVKQKCPDLPVIIVSGNLGEEAAIETLKKGATDYVLKQRLQRLTSAVKRALKESIEHQERIQAIQALKESEERFRKLFECSNDAILLHHSEGDLLDVNQNTVKLLKKNKENILRLKLQEIFNHREMQNIEDFPDDLKKVNGTNFEVELQIDNDIKWLKVHISLVDADKDLMQTIIKNVTDKKKVEHEKESLHNQLIQSQKMEAVGTLAGGVAHDFNNLLTVIQGFTDLVLVDLDQKDPHYFDLEQVRTAAQSASRLTRQLLMFSRNQPMDFALVNLNRIIEELVKMLKRLIGERISIHTNLANPLWMMRADAGCLEQILMNLVVNAKDAMPEGGRIELETESVIIDSDYCKQVPEASEGHFVLLEVKDSGVGMDDSVKQHIFEPFYTTKGIGKGTGLGLSVVFGIVKQHQGWIELESSPGNGTTFRLFFPACIQDDIANNKCLCSELQPGKGETILLVEDENSTRNFVKQALLRHHYSIIEAGSCAEAKEQFSRSSQSIVLLFTDIILPDGTGVELYKKLVEVKPELKVLYTSGYTNEAIELTELRKEGILFLQKPYNISTLLEIVKESLSCEKK